MIIKKGLFRTFREGICQNFHRPRMLRKLAPLRKLALLASAQIALGFHVAA